MVSGGTVSIIKPHAALSGGHFRDGAAAPADRGGEFVHDLLHELSTIMLLSSLLSEASELEPDTRRRARQIMAEISWLEKLVLVHRDGDPIPDEASELGPVRLDTLIAKILLTVRSETSARIRFAAQPVHVQADGIALGRAVRNVVWNALNVVGPTGEIAVRVRRSADLAVIAVDDDGPGYRPGSGPTGRSGLGIVRQVAASSGGVFRIGRSPSGGARAELVLPVAVDRGTGDTGADSDL